jgi:hypothetical protein
VFFIFPVVLSIPSTRLRLSFKGRYRAQLARAGVSTWQRKKLFSCEFQRVQVESEEEIAKPQARKNIRGKISELCGIVGLVFIHKQKGHPATG